MGDDDGEDGIAARQDGRVYPVGRALRSTYDAENHDTLGSDLTGLMIDLSRVPFDSDLPPRPAIAAMGPMDRAPAPAGRTASGWLARLGAIMHRR